MIMKTNLANQLTGFSPVVYQTIMLYWLVVHVVDGYALVNFFAMTEDM